MNNINYKNITHENSLFKCMNHLVYLTANNEPTDAICYEIAMLQCAKIDICEPRTVNTQVDEFVYHKLWHKLKPFQRTNRIELYVNELKSINENNAKELIANIIKALASKTFVATNLSYKKDVPKKQNKYVIDYDPVKGRLVNIEGITYDNGKYTCAF